MFCAEILSCSVAIDVSFTTSSSENPSFRTIIFASLPSTYTHISPVALLTVRYFRFPILSVHCLPLQEFCHRLFYRISASKLSFSAV